MKHRLNQLQRVLLITLALPFLCIAQDGGRDPGEHGGHRAHAERTNGSKAGGKLFKGDWLETMQTENPEEYERLQKLREDDPDAFREEMRRRVRDRFSGMMRQRGGKLDATCQALRTKYHAADSADAKAAVKAELETAVFEAFDARLSGQKKMVAQLEAQLERLKNRIASREKNRGEICQRRLDELTQDPALGW